MKLNFKTLAYIASAVVMIGAPLAFINTAHYSPRFSENEKSENKSQSIAGAYQWYMTLFADPATGLIDENAREAAYQEGTMKMKQFYAAKSSSVLGLNWTEMGPDNVGGRTRSIVFDKNHSGVMYAAAVSGGIFKSTNGGTSWAPINDQLSNMVITCMSQDASGANIYFGTGEVLGSYPSGDGNSAFVGGGLFKLDLATNAVASILTTTSTAYKNVNKIVCDKTDNNKMYMATGAAGFKYTEDAGATWKSVKNAVTLSPVATIGASQDVKLASDGSFVFSAGLSLYKSTSVDSLVTDITPTVVPTRNSMEIAIAPSDPNVIYVSIVDGPGKLAGVVQSVDKGTTWVKIANASSATFDPFISGGNGQGNYDNAITVDPNNPYRVFVGGAAFYKWEQVSPTSIGVGSWNYAAYQFATGTQYYVHSDIHTFSWDPFNSSKLIVGSDGGMARSLDAGLTYATINKGYNATQYYGISYQRFPVLGASGFPMGGVVGGAQDNGTSFVPGNYNGVKGSYAVGGGDGNFCDFSHIAPSAVFSSIYYGQVLRTAGASPSGGSSEFTDVQYNSTSTANNGGPGAGGFASFVTPIRLWEKTNDYSSIDSVTFTASPVINNSAGVGTGTTKIFYTKVTKSNNSAIFDSVYVSIGTNKVGNTYTIPTTMTLAGNNLTVTPIPYTSASYDSLKIEFATPPVLNAVIKTEVTQKYLSGAEVAVTSKVTSGTKFQYFLLSAIPARASVKIVDIMQARLAVGLTGKVVVVKKPLDFGITPDWCTVASSVSRDESGATKPFSGTVQTMTWDHTGDNLYVGTQTGILWKISHLRSLIDSVGVKGIDSLRCNTIDSTGGLQRKRSPIRCTKIGTFGAVITSIAVDPINSSSIVVTCGTYGTNPKVYYAANPNTFTTTVAFGLGAFVSKMGTGLVSQAPAYSSLIEMNNTNRVLLGTEYGLYATDDITVANPVWTLENNSKLPNVPIFMLRQQTYGNSECYNSGMIYAGTHGRGIWACDTYYSPSVVGIKEIAAKDKTATSSIKIYPNPAREMTNLSFKIEKSEQLTLNVYDLRGELVITRNLGKLPEGDQLMQIGTEDLVSGTYIVCLNSSTTVVGTNRLIVIK